MQKKTVNGAKLERDKARSIILFCAFTAGLFIGIVWGNQSGTTSGFTKGYAAAIKHVSSTIKAKSAQNSSFYMTDLGIKFIAQGNDIIGIKYVGNAPGTDTRGQAPDLADVVHVAVAKR
jgi:hypothetical protein